MNCALIWDRQTKIFSGVEKMSMGSSLKLCALADAGADLYPRLGLTSEWDIAAAHAVFGCRRRANLC